MTGQIFQSRKIEAIMPEKINAVSVAIFSGHRVLLIKRIRAPFAGYWTLPGGRVERNETPEDAALREVKEELGTEVSNLRPVTLFQPDPELDWWLQVFTTPDFCGDITPNSEIDAWQWSAPDVIDDLTTTPGLAVVLRRSRAVLLNGQ